MRVFAHLTRAEVRLFLREPMQLARFGAADEAGLDQVRVGHAAPDAREGDRAVLGEEGAPPRFGIAHLQVRRGLAQRLGAALGVQVGIERADQRHRLDDGVIILARHEAH